MKKNIVIVGAGVSGLTFAQQFLEKGHVVTLVEAEKDIGGLARSFKLKGCNYDIGPHRFHTESEEVKNYILRFLGDKYITIDRNSKVYAFGKYFKWPLRIFDFYKVPAEVLFGILMDFLKKRNKKEGRNFETHIISKYGYSLYYRFFKEYTEKFLGIKCREIDKNWAITSIKRAAIKDSYKFDNLYGLVYSSLFTNPHMKFIYPIGGNDMFARKLEHYIKQRGGNIFLSSRVSGIKKNSGKIVSVHVDNKDLLCDWLVWTGDILSLSKLMGIKEPRLEYLNLVLYLLQIKGNINSKFQWCYFGNRGSLFVRISNYNEFYMGNAPEGITPLGLEVPCRDNDDIWINPEKYTVRIMEDFLKLKLVNSKEKVLSTLTRKVKNAYPIYRLGYNNELTRVRSNIKKFKNLTIAGRTAGFWYNNQDHSISQALSLSKIIMNNMSN